MTDRPLVVALALLLVLILAACGSAASVMPYESVEPLRGDVANGEELYHATINRMPPCSSCHVEGAAGAPSLVGYAEVAGERVEGQDAHEYTFYAIAEPAQYIVEGYGNAMYARYDENMNPQQMADLIAYLLSGDL